MQPQTTRYDGINYKVSYSFFFFPSFARFFPSLLLKRKSYRRMPNITDTITDTSNITQTIGNLARAATTRRRHSTHISSHTNSSSSLTVPQPPQHTNVAVPNPRLSGDFSNSHSPLIATTMDHTNNRRSSQAGLVDVPASNLVIEFDGGTHVIVRPNRIIRGKVILTTAERLYVTRIRIKVSELKSACFIDD